ncbi:hypothetical protein FH972_008399 [Carpinus fangiana]|uniref:Uncharacterized protein n=1 Tax=Carpinus fangiana TaxID=176857 RepID=A0A5N6R1X8_9ROSI|nr:hypothetical protein FH972_008399 [Carpinus fangiana]
MNNSPPGRRNPVEPWNSGGKPHLDARRWKKNNINDVDTVNKFSSATSLVWRVGPYDPTITLPKASD